MADHSLSAPIPVALKTSGFLTHLMDWTLSPPFFDKETLVVCCCSNWGLNQQPLDLIPSLVLLSLKHIISFGAHEADEFPVPFQRCSMRTLSCHRKWWGKCCPWASTTSWCAPHYSSSCLPQVCLDPWSLLLMLNVQHWVLCVCVKGDPGEWCRLAWERRKCAKGRLCMVILWLFNQQKYLFALNLSSLWCSHSGLLFTNEEQKNTGSLYRRHFNHTCQPCSRCHTDHET